MNDLGRLRSYNYACIVFENYFPIIPYLSNCYALSDSFLFFLPSKYHKREVKETKRGWKNNLEENRCRKDMLLCHRFLRAQNFHRPLTAMMQWWQAALKAVDLFASSLITTLYRTHEQWQHRDWTIYIPKTFKLFIHQQNLFLMISRWDRSLHNFELLTDYPP